MQYSLLLLAIVVCLTPSPFTSAKETEGNDPQIPVTDKTCEHDIKLKTLKDVDEAANIPLDEEDLVTGTVWIELGFRSTCSQDGIGCQK